MSYYLCNYRDDFLSFDNKELTMDIKTKSDKKSLWINSNPILGMITAYLLILLIFGGSWFFFFKDAPGTGFEAFQSGIKNMIIFVAKIVTAAIILLPSTHLINFVEDKLKIESAAFSIKLGVMILNFFIGICILIIPFYFELNLFSWLINRIF